MPTVVQLLAASLVLVPALAAAAPAPTPGDPAAASPPPASPPLQRPVTPGLTAPAGPAQPPGATSPTPASTSESVPLVPAPTPDDPNTVSDPGDPPGATPDPAPPPVPPAPGLAEQLLGPSVNRHPTDRPAGPVRSETESAEEEDAAIAAMYRNLYRPANNPGRINLVARAVFVLAGSVDNTLSGRLGGLTVDIGQSFNKVGYALTLVGQFGSLIHTKPDRETQSVALVGGGPTLSLGRLALLQRGFLDVRVGYDFLAAPTRAIVDGVATADGVRAPHGPRLSLNMGLLGNSARARKLFHGFGLSLGYQALIGDLRGQWPVTNMLQFGLVYWGG